MNELIGGLLAVQGACRSGGDPERLLRKIDQMVGVYLARAGVEDAGAAERAVVTGEEERRYLVDLGNVQMLGRLGDDGVPVGDIWVNDTAVEAEGLEITIRMDEPVKVHLLGVHCHDRGRESAGSDHADKSA